MSVNYKNTGLISKALLFILGFFGFLSILCMYLYDPTFSGWTYTTSLRDAQLPFTTFVTYIADTYFRFFGVFGYIVALIIGVLHFVFLFQRTKTGFSWLAWLGFILGVIVLFFGAGIIYGTFAGQEAVYKNIYPAGGIVAEMINYLTSSSVVRLIIGLIFITLGAMGAYISLLSKTLQEYFNYLRGEDLSALDLEDFDRNVYTSKVLAEAISQQRQRLAKGEEDSLTFYFLPGHDPATLLTSYQKEYTHLKNLVQSYDSLGELTPQQQQTQIVLQRMLEHKEDEYRRFLRRVGSQSFWFFFLGKIKHLLGRDKVSKFIHNPISLSSVVVTKDADDIFGGEEVRNFESFEDEELILVADQTIEKQLASLDDSLLADLVNNQVTTGNAGADKSPKATKDKKDKKNNKGQASVSESSTAPASANAKEDLFSYKVPTNLDTAELIEQPVGTAPTVASTATTTNEVKALTEKELEARKEIESKFANPFMKNIASFGGEQAAQAVAKATSISEDVTLATKEQQDKATVNTNGSSSFETKSLETKPFSTAGIFSEIEELEAEGELIPSSTIKGANNTSFQAQEHTSSENLSQTQQDSLSALSSTTGYSLDTTVKEQVQSTSPSKVTSATSKSTTKATDNIDLGLDSLDLVMNDAFGDLGNISNVDVDLDSLDLNVSSDVQTKGDKVKSASKDNAKSKSSLFGKVASLASMVGKGADKDSAKELTKDYVNKFDKDLSLQSNADNLVESTKDPSAPNGASTLAHSLSSEGEHHTLEQQASIDVNVVETSNVKSVSQQDVATDSRAEATQTVDSVNQLATATSSHVEALDVESEESVQDKQAIVDAGNLDSDVETNVTSDVATDTKESEDAQQDIDAIAREFLESMAEARRREQEELELERETLYVDPDLKEAPETTSSDVLFERVFGGDEQDSNSSKQAKRVDYNDSLFSASNAMSLFGDDEVEVAAQRREQFRSEFQAKQMQEELERQAAHEEAQRQALAEQTRREEIARAQQAALEAKQAMEEVRRKHEELARQKAAREAMLESAARMKAEAEARAAELAREKAELERIQKAHAKALELREKLHEQRRQMEQQSAQATSQVQEQEVPSETQFAAQTEETLVTAQESVLTQSHTDAEIEPVTTMVKEEDKLISSQVESTEQVEDVTEVSHPVVDESSELDAVTDVVPSSTEKEELPLEILDAPTENRNTSRIHNPLLGGVVRKGNKAPKREKDSDNSSEQQNLISDLFNK